MRIHLAIILTLLTAVSSVQASETISQQTLDNTLIEAQNAIQAKDYATAFELYSTAARWGHKGAQYVIGEMFMQGKGVARDEVMGFAWLDVAAEAPDREFLKARKAAGKALSEAEMREATALAERISSAYGIEAAGVRCNKEMRPGSNIKVVNCYHRNTTVGGDLIVPDRQDDIYPAS
jgi:TPR repeat protein